MSIPPRNNPRALLPDEDSNVGANQNPAASLVECMADVVDDARQLNTDIGVRPYRVFSVVIRWSGGQVGRGEPTVIQEREFLPTPKVSWTPDRLYSENMSGGILERGDVTLTEVSPRLTEDDIRQMVTFENLSTDCEAFVEIAMDRRDGPNVKRRRFSVKGVPFRRGDKFDWLVRLTSQDSDRNRDRSVRTVSMRDQNPERR